ncbi:MAG: 4Fe-4S dicluster domain-containing protein [Cyclobacteriaceae bacterium]
MRYAMVIDTKKCVGCSDCVVACQTENKVANGYSKSWITESVSGQFPHSKLEFRSERCNHCYNAPCVRTCPTGASFVAEGGVVLVKSQKCIGCGACVESCPYDARFMSQAGPTDKCTFCHPRITQGQNPACVDVCPTKCMYFGDIDDSTSEISQLLEQRQHKTLLPEAGTAPRIFYLT